MILNECFTKLKVLIDQTSHIIATFGISKGVLLDLSGNGETFNESANVCYWKGCIPPGGRVSEAMS